MADPALLAFAGRLSRGEIIEALQQRQSDLGIPLRPPQTERDPPPPSLDALLARLPTLSRNELEQEIRDLPDVPALAPCRDALQRLLPHLDQIALLPFILGELCTEVLNILTVAPGEQAARIRLINRFQLQDSSGWAAYDARPQLHRRLRELQKSAPDLWKTEGPFFELLLSLAPLSLVQRLF